MFDFIHTANERIIFDLDFGFISNFSIVIHPILFIALFIAAYALINNKKWDYNLLGLGSSIAFAVLNTSSIIFKIQKYDQELAHKIPNIFFVILSVLTFILTIFYLKDRKNEEILFKSKGKKIIFSFLIILSVNSLFLSFHIVNAIIRFSIDMISAFSFNIFIYFIASLILLYSAYGLLINKTNSIKLGLAGIIILLIGFIIEIYYILEILNSIVVYRLRIFVLFGFTVFVFFVMLFYWKKLPKADV